MEPGPAVFSEGEALTAMKGCWFSRTGSWRWCQAVMSQRRSRQPESVLLRPPSADFVLGRSDFILL